jgi:hypothetical protein
MTTNEAITEAIWTSERKHRDGARWAGGWAALGSVRLPLLGSVRLSLLGSAAGVAVTIPPGVGTL